MILKKIIRQSIRPNVRSFEGAKLELRRNFVVARHPSQDVGGVDHDDLGQLLYLLQPDELEELGISLPEYVPHPWKPMDGPITRQVRIQAISTANSDGSQAATVMAEDVSLTVERINDFFGPIGIEFVFDKSKDFKTFKNTLLNQDGVLMDSSPASNPNGLLDDTAYFAERQRVADQHLGKLVLYFSYGTYVVLNDEGKWETVQRGFGYSSGGCHFVALCAGPASEGFAAHEIGHYLHLGHTHGAEPKTINEAAEIIRNAVEPASGVTADNALTIFDADEEVVWDTPPDPGPSIFDSAYGSGACCTGTSHVDVPVTFFPNQPSKQYTKNYRLEPDRANLMSYFKDCTQFSRHFSNEQRLRMHTSMQYGNRHHLIAATPQGWKPPPPTLVSWDVGRIDLFAIAGDACLYHKHWANDSVLNSLWNCLGGYLLGTPAVVSWAPGRFDIFVRTISNTVQHKGWNDAEGWFPSKMSWNKLGGVISDDPVAVTWGVGRLDIIVRSSDGGVWHKCWNDASGWYPSITEWSYLGNGTSSRPTLISWGPGRLDIFARAHDSRVLHKSYDEAGGWFPSQEGWEDIGGSITGSPAAVSWGPGRIDVVVSGSDRRVWHKCYEPVPGWYPSQTGWNPLAGVISESPTIASWKTGRFDIIVRGGDGGAWHKGYDSATGWFPGLEEPWTSLGGELIGSPQVISWGPGRLDIVARGANGKVMYKGWDDAKKWFPSKGTWLEDTMITNY